MAIRAVMVDPDAPGASGRLVIRDVADPSPDRSEAIVRVSAISLNRGEIRRSLTAAAGWRPGWDFSGTVERTAADGSGPKAGTRVVGMLGSGAWAERIAAPTHTLAELPESVSDAQAATLPVAGLTALYALRKGGLLLERPTLITGATGGVGDFALQLARLSGARVVAHVRHRDQENQVRGAGAAAVVMGEDLPEDGPFGPYHLVVDSVGGKTLGAALNQVAEGGTVISLGSTAGAQVTFDASRFYPTGRASLYGFILFDEIKTDPAGRGLEVLLRLVAAGKLTTRISVEADWSEVAAVSRQLMERAFTGKAVLHLS